MSDNEYSTVPEPPGAHGGDIDDCEWCKWFLSPRMLSTKTQWSKP
jgi:hypothetical protein